MSARCENTGDIVSEFAEESDGCYRLKLTDGSVYTFGFHTYSQLGYLFPGQVLDKKSLSLLAEAEDLKPLLDYALRLISRRPYSSGEISAKLVRVKKASKTTADKIARQLLRRELIDDERLAAELVEEYRLHGYDRKLIARKLNMRLLDRRCIESALEGYEYDEEKVLEFLRQRYRLCRSRSRTETRRYLTQSLQTGRGFTIEDATALVNEFLAEQSVDREREQRLLQEQAHRIYNRVCVRQRGFKARRAVIGALMRKGFAYDDILEEIKDPYFNFDAHDEESELEGENYEFD